MPHPHRQIWEEYHGRKIPKGHHIHHWDGDHNNNRVGNLFCCSAEDHWLIHYIQGDPVAVRGKFIQGASEAGKLSGGSKKGRIFTKEHRRKISEARQGMKFSDEHRKHISEYLKTCVGEKNHFYGKKHRKESMEKRTATRRARGIKPAFTGKGTKWFTNGIEDRMCFSAPVGFYSGRTKNRKEK